VQLSKNNRFRSANLPLALLREFDGKKAEPIDLENPAAFSATAPGLLNHRFPARIVEAGPLADFPRRAIAPLADIVFIQHANIDTR
jgi:hypothetical protein